MGRTARTAPALLLPAVLLGLTFATRSSGYALLAADWSWQAAPISEVFSFNVASFPASVGTDPEIEAAYTGAMDRWTFDSFADVAYLYGGTTASTSYTVDADNVGWYDPAVAGGGTLAVAQSWWQGNDIVDCDIAFFGSNGFGPIDWSADPAGAGNNEIDFELTATHELGHCLGLDHSTDPAAIMYFSQAAGSGPADRALHPDDQAGAQALYGNSGAADLVLGGMAVVDLGDGDGALEPGEAFSLVFVADNLAASAAIRAITTTTSADPDITVTAPTGLPSLGPDLGALSSDSFEGTAITVSPTCTTNHAVTFSVTIEADNFSPETYAFRRTTLCDPNLTLATGDWVVGGAAYVEVTGAIPGESVKILRSTGGQGAGSCPAPLGGLCLDVRSPLVIAQTVTANPSGVARWDFVVPATAPVGADLWVQAIAVRGPGGADSVKSNVEARTIAP